MSVYKEKSIDLQWLGLMPYEPALKYQIETADKVRAGGPAVVIGCHHESVVTFGKRSQPIDDILVSMETLRSRKIEIIATDRGGHATLHNPGQLIIYPILPIRAWGLGVRDYVESLEKATALYLAERGVEVERGFDPGLFVDGRKIASFGIRVDRGVTMHGLAINIWNSLEDFSLIKQCGMKVQATNMESEMLRFMPDIPPWDFEEEAKVWIECFKNELQNIGHKASMHPSLDLPADL